jgi:hypothetical protein
MAPSINVYIWGERAATRRLGSSPMASRWKAQQTSCGKREPRGLPCRQAHLTNAKCVTIDQTCLNPPSRHGVSLGTARPWRISKRKPCGRPLPNPQGRWLSLRAFNKRRYAEPAFSFEHGHCNQTARLPARAAANYAAFPPHLQRRVI